MPHDARRWSIKTTSDVRAWLRALRQDDPDVYRSVNVAIDMLAEIGPALGRPMVDTLQGSPIRNLKELRPRSGRDVAIRVLFVFDPWSQAVLLVAGNKAGDWSRWYKTAIPVAEGAYETWLAEERKRRGDS
ncbi:type II toxin-antitoxin system RelE/ParE family toxin [Paractinoplanes hotanensis]|uniref:Type II toxin-antitoxin system RelE/ParE family toxin n=1 Tax=Paractinoplanes hotanensis TaxID=2906497 RepID=A0ABT0Y8F1_9ACTN|nr:type II toxin-antitoxin system RelE/ParE family toxin [Actinoplanes hotanensis]MCM4082070.1 type II toxin-antitoxin system RelE/ParE family toxin [Actinoplanes hotanensis]